MPEPKDASIIISRLFHSGNVHLFSMYDRKMSVRRVWLKLEMYPAPQLSSSFHHTRLTDILRSYIRKQMAHCRYGTDD